MGDLSEHFSRVEFACKCGCGFDSPSPRLVEKLEEARARYGKPIYITSGCRCPDHNAAVGGVDDSTHMSGEAADIGVAGGRDRYHLVVALIDSGFTGIGVAKGFIHGDIATSNMNRIRVALWSY